MTLEALEQEGELVRAGWTPRPWWAYTLALLALGSILLLVAGVQLSDARFGTQLRARGCDPSAGGGLVLLALGSFVMMLAFTCTRLRREATLLEWDPTSLFVTLPAPLTLLAATLPGVLGCSVRSDIAGLDLVGDALVGTSGVMLAAAATTLVGVALGAVAQVVLVAGDLGGSDEVPSLVELAMAEAEALEAEGASDVFRGVDSGSR